jgi:hypothetical protein
MSSYTITNTPGSVSTMVDYTAEDAAWDARSLTRIFVVVEDATGEDITDVMTYAEASKYIMDMSQDPRPNAVKGWMHIEEREVEVFTEEQEAMFNEIREAMEDERGAKLAIAFASNGTPEWKHEQMRKTLVGCQARTTKAMANGSMSDAKAFGRWLKIHSVR